MNDLHWQAVGHDDLHRMLPIEARCHSHPWSLQNFQDSLWAGYRLQGVWLGDELVAYSVLMQGVEEVHVLNISVLPERQGQGLGKALLTDACAWGRSIGALSLWLEVRASNERALGLYDRFGLSRAGLRKGYYPASRTEREDAVVMSLVLQPDTLEVAP
jgi:[ribosomal protein S18]-alanine N-acetyltransferase